MAVDIHGKSYKMVAERVNEIHAKYINCVSITTEIINENWLQEGTVVMKTTLEVNHKETGVCRFTGHAYEKLGATPINSTSALENCETSAIGRALASAGFAGNEFASADELVNALDQQRNRKAPPQQTSGSAQKPKGKLIGRWDGF